MNENAFLHTICAHPDDDAPRLVFADWLDERGDPLGEFIRVQVELAKINVTHSRFGQLRSRQLELMLDNVPRWVQPYGLQIFGAEFKRGFLCVGSVGAKTLLDDQPWFERWPWEVLRIWDGEYHDPMVPLQLLQSPVVTRLKLLDLHALNLADDLLRRFVDIPNLRDIRRIELGQNTPSRRTASILIQAFGQRIQWSWRGQQIRSTNGHSP